MITVRLEYAELFALLRALERLAALPDVLIRLHGRLVGLLASAPVDREVTAVSNDSLGRFCVFCPILSGSHHGVRTLANRPSVN